VRFKRYERDVVEEKKILAITSFAEFSERYGYYTLQALLIFFLITKFNMSTDDSASLVGVVISMVYISAIVGGYVAERLLGYYRSGMLGSLLMVLGSCILATATDENMLFIGLSFISLSTGLIKSNMASFIGRFYDKSGLDDSNRDFGFNIFYVGINSGALAALLFASYLRDNYGFDAAFYSISVVSLIMFVVLCMSFFFLRKHIIDLDLSAMLIIEAIAIMSIYVVILFFIFKNPLIANFSSAVALGASIVILIMSLKVAESYKTVIIASIFFILSIVYWGLYFQIFITLLLFIKYSVSSDVLNSSQLLGVVSLGIVMFGFLIGKFWMYLVDKNREVTDISKFNIGFMLLTVSFTVILISIIISPANAKVGVLGFVIGFLILSLSDLSLSAIGLSLITKIAPKGFVSLYMGIWLITLGLGGRLGGYLAGFIHIPENELDIAKINMIHGLCMFITIAVVVSILLFIIKKTINKHM
jgi:POT family proton-dependent oligopeptide transporter